MVNPAENNQEDLLHDLASIIMHFFGRGSSKQHIEQVKTCIEQAIDAKDK